MGIESVLGAVAGPVIGGILGGSGSKKSGNQTSTNKVELDPRMQGILYGGGESVLRPGVEAKMGIGTEDDYRRYLNNEHLKKYGIDIPTDQASQDWLTKGVADLMAAGHQVQINPESDYDNGILDRITGLLDQPQNAGISHFGSEFDNYLGQFGRPEFDNNMRAAVRLRDLNFGAPTAQAAQIGNVPGMSAAQVNAPSQNNLNLSPAYQDLIYGNPAENQYLTGAIQKGINQSNTAFGNMLQDATRNLTQSILPNIRSGAIVNGAMGGSRQGIAEARALEDFSTQMGRAASQFGQNNTDAAVGAQAGAFDAGQGRKLAAVQGLGGQQYTTALTDAGFQQQANQTNYQGNLQKAMQDAQFRQQAGLTNQNAQLATNQQNANNLSNGISASSGLIGQAYGFGTNADSYAGQKVGQVAGLLQPFTGLGATQSSTQPLYSNTGAGVLGGAMLGQQLAKGFGSGNNYGTWMNGNVNSTGLDASTLLGGF